MVCQAVEHSDKAVPFTAAVERFPRSDLVHLHVSEQATPCLVAEKASTASLPRTRTVHEDHYQAPHLEQVVPEQLQLFLHVTGACYRVQVGQQLIRTSAAMLTAAACWLVC
jgi:hypothetical protein